MGVGNCTSAHADEMVVLCDALVRKRGSIPREQVNRTWVTQVSLDHLPVRSHDNSHLSHRRMKTKFGRPCVYLDVSDPAILNLMSISRPLCFIKRAG